MSAPNDQFVDITKRSQEAVTTAVRTWTDTVQSFAGGLTGGQAKLPDAQAFVDTFFDFAEKVLTNQREIAHQWLTAAQKATEAVTEQASRATESVTAHGVNGVEAVADNTAEAARITAEKTASTARAARNVAKA